MVEVVKLKKIIFLNINETLIDIQILFYKGVLAKTAKKSTEKLKKLMSK